MDDFSKYQDQLNQVSGQLNEQNVLESAQGAKEKAKVMADRFKEQVIGGFTEPLGIDLIKNSASDFVKTKGTELKNKVYKTVKDKVNNKLDDAKNKLKQTIDNKINPNAKPKITQPTPEDIESRSKLDQSIKFRDGDIKPEDIVRGNSTLEDLRNNNEARYTALSAEDRNTANDALQNKPGYRRTQDINSDTSLTDEERAVQLKNNYFTKQDVMGDVEALDKPQIAGAVPGGVTRGVDRKITGKMSDAPEGMLEEATEESATDDFDPVGLAITAGLGIATLFSSLFGHHKDAMRHPIPIPIDNPSTNFGT